MKSKSLLLLAALAWSNWCSASQFYVFPVNELDGVSLKVTPESRPMIDKRVRSIFSPEVQASILSTFDKELVGAFPESSVHARQVTGVKKGQYKYIESPTCKDGFTAPIKSSYAAVIGLTRASWYEVERDGGRVEILIPITLNIQLIKPDLSKVVYTVNETLYSPFLFSKDELGTPGMSAKISDVVVRGLNSQIVSLIDTLKKNFRPKDIPINIVGQEQGVLVVDQGFEVGFRADDELQGSNAKSGNTALFRVVNVDSGYAILKLLEGTASKGDSFVFTFESAADDSRKPRVMPITNTRPEGQVNAVISEIFSKNLGFKASFQLAPVDVNFSETMSTIRFAASCVPWDNYPSTKQIFESRHDNPDFFLKFNLSKSPTARQSGLGAVKTSDSFITSVTAQLIDKGGNVIFSEIGTDRYNLEKTSGQGLSMASAQEISIKNATSTLASRFIENVKFENGNFKISSIEKNSFNADGLILSNGVEPSYEILRPLSTQINGKPVFMRVAVDKGSANPTPSLNGTSLSYSKIETTPASGDLLRIMNMPRPGQIRISECVGNYKSAASIGADYLTSLVKHAAYKSARFQPGLIDSEFYADANTLLSAGFFRLQLVTPAATEQCIKTGYSIVPTPEVCQENTCSTKSLFATTLILEKAGTRVGNYVQAETVTFEGFSKSETANFVGFKAYESVLKNLSKLTESSNVIK